MRHRWLPIPLCLTLSAAVCYLAQSHPYSPDPPTQTDRIFYKGWPRPYERTGGFAGFHDRYPAALALDIAVFIAPGLLIGVAAAAILRRRPAQQ